MKRILLPAIALFFTTTTLAQRIPASRVNMTDVSNREKLRAPFTGEPGNINMEAHEEEFETIPILEAPPGARVSSLALLNRPASSDDAGLFNPPRRNATESVVQSFQGINDDTFLDIPSGNNVRSIPPDVMGAVGPSHVMSVHNNKYRVTDKSGTELTYVDAQAFWSGTTGYGTGVNDAKGHSDPHVLYNHYQNRWILIAQSNFDNGSAIMVAVSTTADPTGAWTRYVIDADPSNTRGFDYPLLGFNQNWLVISGNMFGIAGGGFQRHQIYILDIANLVAGGALVFTGGGENAQLIEIANTTQSGWSAPCTVYESGAPTATMHIVQPFWAVSGNTALRISTLTGTIPAVTWNTGTAVFVTSGISNFNLTPSVNYTNGNFSPQATDPRRIDANDGRVCNSVIVNGNIWTAQHIFLPDGTTHTRSAVQWWQITTAGTVLQNGRIDDASGFLSRSFPSIAVNNSEDVVVGYTLTSPSSYASAAYSIRKACTPANAMEYEVIYRQGADWYYKDFSQGAGRDRWGDYSASCVDPSTGRLWTVQEYAATRAGTADNSSRWGSWWAEIQPEANNAISWETGSSQTVSETGNAGSCPTHRDITVRIKAFCAASGAATVNISSAGSTAGATDFTVLTPSVVFANGEQTKDVTVRILDDGNIETNESIVLSYSISGSGVTAAADVQTQTAVILISDNDAAPVASGSSTTVSLGVNSFSGGFNQPFRGNGFSDARTQFIYTGAELQATGLGAGNITAITIPVVTKATTGSGNYSNFTISMKVPTASSFTGTTLEAGLTTVFTTASFTPIQGDNVITLSTPFAWDGSSDLLFEICWDNAANLTNADFTKASVTTTNQCVWNRVNVAAATPGCTLAGAFNQVNTQFVRPDIRLSGQARVNPVQSALINQSFWFGPNASVYIYNGTNIMARLVNNSSHDYGCTQVEIDRTGTGSTQFWNTNPANYLVTKTFRVIPTNNNASGSYTITLYYSAAEISDPGGWQLATGQTWTGGSTKIVKVPNQVNDITPASSPTGIEVNMGSIASTFGNNYSITATFTSGFSGFGAGVPGSAPLPVSFLSFDGRKNGTGVDLEWKTAFEQNNDRFEIETSKDGNSYYKIGEVPSKGNSTDLQSYLFTDNLPVQGVNYYRLKQVDLDSRSAYSRIIAISFDGKGRSVSVYPNPAKDKLTIGFSSPQEKITIRILSADGKEISKEAVAAAQRNHELNITGLTPGAYLLEVIQDKQKHTVKFVKE